MTDKHARIEFGGESLRLLPGRAAWLPERRALLIADAHVGKGGYFRAQGIAVPRGSSRGTLDRLSQLVRDLSVSRVYSLGDFLHAAPTAEVLQSLANWRDRHPDLAVTLIPGNHDRRLASLAGGTWTVENAPTVGALTLQHEPEADCPGPTACGHLHPVLRLGAGRADRLVTPVFWLSGHQLVLPAFGNFTGGFRIRPKKHDRVFAVGPDAVVEVSRASGAVSRPS